MKVIYSSSVRVLGLVAAVMLLTLLGACGGGGNGGLDGIVTSAAVTESSPSSTDATIEGLRRNKKLYRVTDLGLSGGYDLHLNDKGAVLLNRGGAPFVWRNGVDQKLPSGCIQIGYAINNRGAVAGSGSSRPVLYSRGTCHDLGTLGGSIGYARDVNAKNEATGAASLPGDVESHAFLYADGVIRDIGGFGGSSAGYGINSNAEVTGAGHTNTGQTHAFLYRHRQMNDLGTLGGMFSAGYAINDDGHVVGESSLSCGMPPCAKQIQHAFLYHEGVMRDLDTLNSWYSVALSINGSGQVAGWLTNNDAFEDFRAFVYKDGAMQVLNDLLDGSGTGWILQAATSINDSGEIVGYGYLNGQIGQTHAFLLSPTRGNDRH